MHITLPFTAELSTTYLQRAPTHAFRRQPATTDSEQNITAYIGGRGRGQTFVPAVTAWRRHHAIRHDVIGPKMAAVGPSTTYVTCA